MTEAPSPPAAARLLFRPDAFFIKPWRGWGVVRDGRGRPVARYETRGQGRTGSRGATTEQVTTFEDGTVGRVEWEIETDEQHYYARDPRTGVEARGRRVGDDFCWGFRAPVKTPLGLLNARTSVTYTLVSPTTAFSFAETRWFGLLLSTYTTFYEQL